MLFIKTRKRNWISHVIGVTIACLTVIYFTLSILDFRDNIFFALVKHNQILRFDIVLGCMIFYDIVLLMLLVALISWLAIFTHRTLYRLQIKRSTRHHFAYFMIVMIIFWMLNILIKNSFHYDIPQIIGASFLVNVYDGHFVLNWILLLMVWAISLIAFSFFYINYYVSHLIALEFSRHLIDAFDNEMNGDCENSEIIFSEQKNAYWIIAWMMAAKSITIKFFSFLRFKTSVFPNLKRMLHFSVLARLFEVELPFTFLFI